MTYPKTIADTDKGWQRITLSAKNPLGINVRTSPVILPNNIAGSILHKNVKPPVSGLVNMAHAVSSEGYVWLPMKIQDSGLAQYPLIWVAKAVIDYTLGEFVNNDDDKYPDGNQFFDYDFLGIPTLRMTTEQKTAMVEKLEWLALMPTMSVIEKELFLGLKSYIESTEGVS